MAPLSVRSALTLIVWSAAVWVFGCAEPQAPTGPNFARGGGQGPTVRETDPSSAPRGTTLNVRVLGSGYDVGSKADWAIDGDTTFAVTKVKTNSTTFVSSTELVANITIEADASITLYDVIVRTAGGKKGIGIERFAVTETDRFAADFDAGVGYLLLGDGLGTYLDDASCVLSRGGPAGGGVYQLRSIVNTPPCLDVARPGWRYFKFNLGVATVDLDQDGIAEVIEDAPARLLAQDAFAQGATSTQVRILVLLVNPDGTTEIDTRWTVFYPVNPTVSVFGSIGRIIEAGVGHATANIYSGYMDTPIRKNVKPVAVVQLPFKLTLTPMAP